jgi:Zn-dependent protease/CBS domain-containing protein
MRNPTDARQHPARQPGGDGPGLPASIPLGRWRGVEVDAHWSVIVTLGLFATVLATQTLPQAHPGDSPTAYWLMAVGTASALLLTLVAHELAHALTARACGMQVTRITLWLLGGVTELGGPSPNARTDGLVALAGPVTSLAVGVVSALLALWAGTGGLLGTALVWLASVSVLLAVFNLLPGAPLDGGRLVRALLWWRFGDRDRAGVLAARAGSVLGYILIALGLLDAFAGLPAGLWLALVGWFILSGAGAEQAAARDQHLGGLSAADVMTPLTVVAPAWWTVEQLVEHLSPNRIAAGTFPVVDVDGHTIGVCTVADLRAVPASHRADTQVGALARGHPSPIIVAPDADAAGIAAQVRVHRCVAVVEAQNRPVGVVTAVELGRAAQLTVLGWRTAPHGS